MNGRLIPIVVAWTLLVALSAGLDRLHREGISTPVLSPTIQEEP